ncbi:MAG TPA: hypothetical protein VIW29_01405 [Polyangiaceae bacterium]
MGGVLLVALASAGCAEGPFLQTEELVTKPGEAEGYVGGSCLGVERGSSSGGATAPGAFGSAGEAAVAQGYSYGYEGRGKAVRFSVSDYDGQILAERSYDAAFLESGRRDVVTLEVFGQTLRFVHWGVGKCGEIRDPSVD